MGVLNLAELVSQGQTFYRNEFAYPDALREGDTGEGDVYKRQPEHTPARSRAEVVQVTPQDL